MVSVVLDTAMPEHGAVAPAVNVNMTLPAVMSAGLGVYVVTAALALPKRPVPLVVHRTDDWFETVPFRFATEPAQMEYGPPVLAVGGPCTLRTTMLLANELPHASLTTTWYVPALASVADGIMYDELIAPGMAMLLRNHW
jgi:hypothetical protein